MTDLIQANAGRNASPQPQDELVALAEADRHRPRFHFVSPAGWLNDPNGVAQWNGTYHLFYQYNPEGPFHGNIMWGHASSTNLVDWHDEPVALEPSAGPDAEGCWSGVLVDDDGVPTLIYSGRHDGVELPCVAVGSPNLRTWSKLPENPVISAPPPGVDVPAFRDHCVWKQDGKWRQVIGSGVSGQGGAAFLYESADLRNWTYLGPLLVGNAAAQEPEASDWQGTMWECVDLFRSGTRDILVFSAWHEGDTRHPLYWTGTYTGDTFSPYSLLRLDYGGRFFYAPQSFEDQAGRRIMFGWLQEGRGESAVRAAGWSGVMSLPRITEEVQGELSFAPVAEIASLRRDHRSLTPRSLGTTEILDGVAGNQLDLELDLELEPGAGFRLGLLAAVNSDGSTAEETVVEVGYDGDEAGTLRLDRSTSSLDPDVDAEDKSGPVPLAGGKLHLRVLVDHSALEIFANGKPLTARVYPSLDGDAIRLSATGTVRLRKGDAWRMAGIFSNPRKLRP
ncbi:glycoside hydrolase family 32 protein [Arthrobacter sp. 35/47]|uniref:glycoside hydrolase family 32 protein n=1 Tax=Arthrobacter sp. 35/47 TaxID=269454 RepID=UPI00047D8C57|nr:glycoside hydrolase family 32 protein [Arthrobacter sp. 35/47]